MSIYNGGELLILTVPLRGYTTLSDIKMTFPDIEKYLKSKGLREQYDYNVNLRINLLELNNNAEYFISVGEWDNNTYEVFAINVGAELDENGFFITDGDLYQYKIFKNLKKAVDFALKCKETRELPKEYIKKW